MTERLGNSNTAQSCWTLRPHGLWPARLLRPWDSPGKNAGVGCHFSLQRTSVTQGQTPVFCISRQIPYSCTTRKAHRHLSVIQSNPNGGPAVKLLYGLLKVSHQLTLREMIPRRPDFISESLTRPGLFSARDLKHERDST